VQMNDEVAKTCDHVGRVQQFAFTFLHRVGTHARMLSTGRAVLDFEFCDWCSMRAFFTWKEEKRHCNQIRRGSRIEVS
jgi:hypothetical protein